MKKVRKTEWRLTDDLCISPIRFNFLTLIGFQKGERVGPFPYVENYAMSIAPSLCSEPGSTPPLAESCSLYGPLDSRPYPSNSPSSSRARKGNAVESQTRPSVYTDVEDMTSSAQGTISLFF
jgi:hypothetical protein